MTAGAIAAVFEHAWQTTTRTFRCWRPPVWSAANARGAGASTGCSRGDWTWCANGSRIFDRTRLQRKVIDMATTEGVNGADVPSLFRVSVEVGDLDRAISFYGRLLGAEGRRQAGSRAYYRCGPVTLPVPATGTAPHTAGKALYFLVDDLEAVHERARELGCLSDDAVHGAPAGQITVRPWGERSFYADDPWGNPLCLVERGTVHAG